MKKAKTGRPTITIYPGDELRSPATYCSLEAQGLWYRMTLLAHDTERPGYLQQNSRPMNPEVIARKCGTDIPTFTRLMLELDEALVCRRTPTGIIVVDTIVNQEKKRLKWRQEKGNLGDKKTPSHPHDPPPVTVSKNLASFQKDSDPISSSFSSSSSKQKPKETKEPKRTPEAEPPPVSPVQELIGYFKQCREATIREPVANFNGGMLGKSFKKWLKDYPESEIKKRVDDWFKSSDPFIVRESFREGLFIGRFNALKDGPMMGGQNGKSNYGAVPAVVGSAKPVPGKYARIGIHIGGQKNESAGSPLNDHGGAETSNGEVGDGIIR